MNKRPIIFVIALIASLFLINQYFDWKNDKRRQELLTEMRIKDQATLEKNYPQRKSKVVSVSQLPIQKLYEDEAQTTFATLAVKDGDDYLTLAWKSGIPKTLYVAGKELTLHSKSPDAGDPAFYSARPHPELLVASPPLTGVADLQLLYFTDNNAQAAVSLGVMEEGRFIGSFDRPPSNCIALFKDDIGYLPYGVYRPTTFGFDLLSASPFIEGTIETGLLQKKIVEKVSTEQYFVLENEYLQLVFSNISGSLAEINLPFRSTNNPNSLVLPIDFDRELAKGHSTNDSYPLNPYFKPGSSQPSNPTLGGYYPLLRRTLLGPDGRVLTEMPHRYYALNLFPANNTTDTGVFKGNYKLTRFEKNLIEFQIVDNGRKITKTYTLPRDPNDAPYSFEFSLQCDGDMQGLELTSGIPEVELISDSFSPSLKYRSIGQKSSVVQMDLPKEVESITGVTAEWVSDANGFFGVIVNPAQKHYNGINAIRVQGDVVPNALIPSRCSIQSLSR